MKLIKYTAAAALLSGVASAQGLFDINPNESETESLPLRYTVGVSYGYDDNVNPTDFGPEESSSYVRLNLGVNLVVRDELTSWDLNATLGNTYNFDDSVANDSTYNSRFALNLNHRINDRTRFVSRNFFNYGLDLGSFYGAVTSRDTDEFTYFSTDNSIGYRWTDRLGTYTGISYSMLNYDRDDRDVNSFVLYNQFRYTLSQQTTLTFNTRYTASDYDKDDSDRITTTFGIERRLSDVSSFVAQIGAQFGDSSSPYGSLNYSYNVNTQLKARVFARYSLEDTDTVFFGDRYEDKTSLRIGGAADYIVSPEVTLTIGGNYTMSDYNDASVRADGDW
ncbi:MAG: hypothetical protein ACI9E1_001799, partial [Cryomorphaceae bacterium]